MKYFAECIKNILDDLNFIIPINFTGFTENNNPKLESIIDKNDYYEHPLIIEILLTTQDLIKFNLFYNHNLAVLNISLYELRLFIKLILNGNLITYSGSPSCA